MHIHSVIERSDPERVEEYLRNARVHPYDPDIAEMTERIVAGKSVYASAKEVYEMNLSERSVDTLQYHARNIIKDLYAWLDKSTADLVGEAMKCEEVECPLDRRAEVRDALRHNGLEFEEVALFRLVERE